MNVANPNFNQADLMNQFDMLKKALEITPSTAGINAANNTLDSQKPESMSNLVISITPTLDDIKFTHALKLIPTKSNTLYQYNRNTGTGNYQTRWGTHAGGQTSVEYLTSPTYDRAAIPMSIHSDSESVSLMTDSQEFFFAPSGVALEELTRRKTAAMLIRENITYMRGNRELDVNQASGVIKSHQYDITNKVFYTPAQYAALPQVKDVRGVRLNIEHINSADKILIEAFDSRPTRQLWTPSTVIEGLTQTNFASATAYARYAQDGTHLNGFIEDYKTTFGNSVGFKFDQFIKRDPPVKPNNPSQLTFTEAPAMPNVSSATAAEVSDTDSAGWDKIGYVYYAVSAVSYKGESKASLISATPTLVTATTGKSVDIKFVSGAGTTAETGYIVYRSETYTNIQSDATALLYYPIIHLTTTEMAAGYDGAGATVVRDRNRVMANTEDAIVCSTTGNLINEDVMHRVELQSAQLNGLTRYILPITGAYRSIMFWHCYTFAMPSPTKVVLIRNIKIS